MTSDKTQNDGARVVEMPAADPWRAIKAGTIVLATSKSEPGWWEAEVIGVQEQGDMITIKWVGYEDEPKFMVPRRWVGLKPPTKA